MVDSYRAKKSGRLQRLGLAASLSAGISFGLFFLMQHLISSPEGLKRSTANENRIDFVRLRQDSGLTAKKRELPKKPEIVDEPVSQQKVAVQQNSTAPSRPTQMKFDAPKLDIPLATGPGGMGVDAGASNAGTGSGDSDEVPLVRVEPSYPQEALSQGITKGWVRLALDLGTDGSVSRVTVVDSNPRQVFDSAAVKSVLKWKYRPKLADGKAVARRGIKIQIDFAVE